MSESQVHSNFFESLQSIGDGILNITKKVNTFSKKIDSFFEEKKESIKQIAEFCVVVFENIDKIENFLHDTHRLKRIRVDLFDLPLEETLELLEYHHSIGTFTINKDGYIDFPSPILVTDKISSNTDTKKKTKWIQRTKKIAKWFALGFLNFLLGEGFKVVWPHLTKLIRDFFT